MAEERLQKILSQAGVASRRHAEKLIVEGRVVVNGAATNLPLLTNTLQSGVHLLRVIYSGDGNYRTNTSDTVTLTILDSVGSFTLSASTISIIAAQGKASSPVTLTATPTEDFHSVITFACTGGLPSGAVCRFAPSFVTPSGSNSEKTALTISPVVSGLETSRASGTPLSRHLSSRIAVALAGMFLFFLPRRSRHWSVFSLLLALSVLGVLSGCGSGGIDPNGSSPGALSTGSYAVTVTATGGSTIQTATINLTIQ